jgi:hypothetical protein
MAYKVHQVKNYNYSYDARAGGPGRLQLWGSQGKIAEISFVDDTSAVPAPILSTDLNSATIFFRRSILPGLIDMLRNESPVSVTINNQPPGFVFVHTGLEPVGEGES